MYKACSRTDSLANEIVILGKHAEKHIPFHYDINDEEYGSVSKPPINEIEEHANQNSPTILRTYLVSGEAWD